MVRSKKGRKGKIQVGKKGTLEAEKKHESLKPCLRHLQYHLMLVYSEVRTSGTHSQRSMQDSTVGNVTSLKGRLILLSKNGGGKNTINTQMFTFLHNSLLSKQNNQIDEANY